MLVQLRHHTSFVWSVEFAPDGSHMVSGSGDGTLRIWDTKPLRERVRARDARRARLASLEARLEELGVGGAAWRELTEADRALVAQLKLRRAGEAHAQRAD